ncbi:MAG: dihydrofolate reductase family protein [Azoarcus sp.]|jgi:riboflavin-specific deaminase-like protein|nr:dihydrofolate reductase family protein [Azoarcus sp.]MDX9837044.1 dihydrofolate reductase family protein [Azoarcus sp.]
MPPSLHADQAWQLILRTRQHDWQGRPLTVLAGDEYELEITNDGSWQCSGDVTAEARDMFDLFLPLVSGPGRHVVGQLGQSLDGRIATVSGASQYINCSAALTHLHRLRAVVDAVVVGVGTVNADNPQLTVRHVPGPHPVRVVIDRRNRACAQARLLHDDTAATLHLVGYRHYKNNTATHSTRIAIDSSGDDAQGDVEPEAILALLARHGLRRILIEGGGYTVSRFIQAGALDRLHLLVAPMLIGSGRPGVSLPPIDTLDDALRPRSRSFACGKDTLFDLALR